jgi:hypothetical protein
LERQEWPYSAGKNPRGWFGVGDEERIWLEEL